MHRQDQDPPSILFLEEGGQKAWLGIVLLLHEEGHVTLKTHAKTRQQSGVFSSFRIKRQNMYWADSL